VQVRNHMGVVQVVEGHRLPPNRWLKVPSELPLEVAMEALRLRHVDIRPADEGSAGLFWMSALSQGDGYGTAAENFLLDLRHMVCPIVVRDCWFRLDEGLDAYTLERLREPVTVLPERGLCMATPGEFRKLPTKYRVGFTMYESDDPLKLHPEWAYEAQFVDKIVVPSTYSKDVFSQFYKGPIQVCDLIVHKDFRTARLREEHSTFTFVTYGTLNGRKSPLETILAFEAAFPIERYPDVRLELKTRGAIFGGTKGHIPTMQDARVKIIDATWGRQALIDWLHKADCMVFCTKGEGYGMPPREAICTGLPTIFANHTGMTDLAEYGYPISTYKTEDSPIGGLWRIPDWEELANQMRYVYEDREKVRQLAVADALAYIQNKTSAAERLLDIINGTARYAPSVLAGETDHTFFYERIRERLSRGRILCIGNGGVAELGSMGYEVFVTNAVPLTVAKDNMPRVDLIVCQNELQKYYHEEIRRMFRNWLEIAPIFFTVPTALAEWPEPNAYLRQRGEWMEIVKGMHCPLQYYNDKKNLMGIVLGSHPDQQPMRTGIYLNGVWQPDQME